MGGNVERVKERLDIVDVVSPYLKLEKAGANFKARCPFHNEKTPSFIISPVRQTYYCFGCGAKGDVISFVQEMEGLDFRGALRQLADKAGVELESEGRVDAKEKALKARLFSLLDAATHYFQGELEKTPEAHDYLASRSISKESVALWRLGWAPDTWRSSYSHLLSLGFTTEEIVKAGLVKFPEGDTTKEPYDVFRGRVMFPLFDQMGKVVAFSGRALAKDAEAKYLNSPETLLFNKSELLYGLDKAKDQVRRRNYAVLVEGQMDLVLSHQAGVGNTVASSGTAFTASHLERIKKISPRVVLAFDGDEAGHKAAEKSSILALSLGMEVKIASLPLGKDPADLIRESADSWKDVLRSSKHAIEHLLDVVLEEKDARKRAKEVGKRILPLIAMVPSAMERAHFVAMIARKTGVKEDVVWEDMKSLKLVSPPGGSQATHNRSEKVQEETAERQKLSRREELEDALEEISSLKHEMGAGSVEFRELAKKEAELKKNLAVENLRERRRELTSELALAEGKDTEVANRLTKELDAILKEIGALEGK